MRRIELSMILAFALFICPLAFTQSTIVPPPNTGGNEIGEISVIHYGLSCESAQQNRYEILLKIGLGPDKNLIDSLKVGSSNMSLFPVHPVCNSTYRFTNQIYGCQNNYRIVDNYYYPRLLFVNNGNEGDVRFNAIFYMKNGTTIVSQWTPLFNFDNQVPQDPIVDVIRTGNSYQFLYQGPELVEIDHKFYSIDYGDGSTPFETNNLSYGDQIGPIHTYQDDNLYDVTFRQGRIESHIHFSNTEYTCWESVTFKNFDPNIVDPCCNSFSPQEGQYWVSAWVHEDHPSLQMNFSHSSIEIRIATTNGPVVHQFYPEGEIIDGWQRIVGVFNVPVNALEFNIDLKNDNIENDAFFDDVRVHPFNASMKSYVYDPENLKLVAELDDNNFATFYEYDKEGKLIRIKKETARGIMTIQESRSSNPKNQPD